MTGTKSGHLRQRIEFQRDAAGRSTLGGKTSSSWGSLGFRRAKVLYGSGQERRESDQERGSQTATFRVRSSALTRGITAKDRILHDGLAWDIHSIAPIEASVREIEFTATAGRG